RGIDVHFQGVWGQGDGQRSGDPGPAERPLSDFLVILLGSLPSQPFSGMYAGRKIQPSPLSWRRDGAQNEEALEHARATRGPVPAGRAERLAGTRDLRVAKLVGVALAAFVHGAFRRGLGREGTSMTSTSAGVWSPPAQFEEYRLVRELGRG